jgi:hypothetical protein
MERRNNPTRRPSDEAPRNRFSGLPLPRERSPREEVIEVLAEGLWTLICQGRGPAAGKFPALQKDASNPDDKDVNTACESSANG